jgi:hypothetical protein
MASLGLNPQAERTKPCGLSFSPKRKTADVYLDTAVFQLVSRKLVGQFR